MSEAVPVAPDLAAEPGPWRNGAAVLPAGRKRSFSLCPTSPVIVDPEAARFAERVTTRARTATASSVIDSPTVAAPRVVMSSS